MRATPAEVVAIFPTTVDVLPFMMTASTLVETTLGVSGLGEPTLREIEIWWTAHLLSLSSPAVISRKLGQTDLTYEHGTLGTGLASTRYGQVVLQLDTSGTLVAASSGKRAWLKVN
jgi:hypothetical protein